MQFVLIRWTIFFSAVNLSLSITMTSTNFHLPCPFPIHPPFAPLLLGVSNFVVLYFRTSQSVVLEPRLVTWELSKAGPGSEGLHLAVEPLVQQLVQQLAEEGRI